MGATPARHAARPPRPRTAHPCPLPAIHDTRHPVKESYRVNLPSRFGAGCSPFLRENFSTNKRAQPMKPTKAKPAKPTPPTKPPTKPPTSKPKPTPPPTNPPEVCDSLRAAAGAWSIPIAALRLAKSSGCPGFVNGRVHRGPVMAWLREHSDVADQAAAVSLEKCTRAELEFSRLKAQTRLAISRADAADRVVILKTEATAEWARAIAILESEYSQFLEPAHFAIAQRRAKLRIGNLLGDGEPAPAPPNSCLTNDPFQTTV
jgi:hypothetical protein